MIKKYKVEVDCAVCANKIANAIKQLPEVEDCTINFMTQKMTLKTSQDQNKELLKKVKKAGEKVEDFEMEF